ncbi:hypothetical protein LCGC14_2362580, partial [marine sediment metagenome]
AVNMVMTVDQSRICENNNDSMFLRDYLEGFIVSDADRRQVERILAESDATKSLRCHFKNNTSLGRTEADYDELIRRFNVLESFVLVPIELENTKELAEEHLNTRLRSIEMLEEVLELVEVKSFTILTKRSEKGATNEHEGFNCG